MTNSKGRGRKLTPSKTLLLMGACGGTCEFPGCGKPLIFEKITGKSENLSNFAHIVAASPNGPRGDESSHDKSDQPENFIVLCPEHHKLIDSSEHRREFPVERLIAMKDEHRQFVQRFRLSLKLHRAFIVILTGSFGNNVPLIDSQKAAASIFPIFSASGEVSRIELKAPFGLNIESDIFWETVKVDLDQQFTIKVLNALEERRQLAVFGLAPIPCLAYLGLRLGCGSNIQLFPVYRDQSLAWKLDEPSLTFEIEKIKQSNETPLQALLIEISGKIDREKVLVDGNTPTTMFSLRVNSPEIDCVKSREDLVNFSKKYIEVLDQFDCSRPIYIFAAVPQTIAIELGRQLLAKHGETVIMHCVNDIYVKGITLKR